MAGGEGAKERRRLKRLAAQEKNEKSVDSQQRTSIKEKSKNNTENGGDHDSKMSSSSFSVKGRNSGGQPWLKKNNHQKRTIKNSKHSAKKEKKSKIKKPKHLKRKLEQASIENGEAKEVIRKQIEQFEARKKVYSKRNDNTKRRKTTHVDSGDGSNNKRNDDEVVSRHTSIDGSCTPLERSNTVEIEKPNLIPDDDIEMTRHKETGEPNGSKGLSTSTVDAEPEEDSSDGNADNENVDEDGDEAASSTNIEDKTSDQSSANNYDNSSDDSSSESEDDSDDDASDDEPMQQRQRGRRRRGRQDTAKKNRRDGSGRK